jgi:hypothetical protein
MLCQATLYAMPCQAYGWDDPESDVHLVDPKVDYLLGTGQILVAEALDAALGL